MLDLTIYKDQVTLFGAAADDDWGIPTVDPIGAAVRCNIKESVELVTMKNQKGKNIIVSYAISFPGEVVINNDMKIGIADGEHLDQFEILKVTRIRDLSGTLIYTKVLI